MVWRTWVFLRWLVTTLPERIARWLYPDAQLAKDIRMRGMQEGEGPTLLVDNFFGIPRLLVKLALDNASPYRTILVDRLVGSIERAMDFGYDGWSTGFGPKILVDTTLTAEQAARFLQIKGSSVVIKGSAKLLCDGRSVVRTFAIPAVVQVAPSG